MKPVLPAAQPLTPTPQCLAAAAAWSAEDPAVKPSLWFTQWNLPKRVLGIADKYLDVIGGCDGGQQQVC